MVQRTEGTLGLLWEVLRAGEVQEIMGGLSLRAEAHEEDGEGAAGGGGREVTGSCCPFRGEVCEGRWSMYDISLLQTVLLGNLVGGSLKILWSINAGSFLGGHMH